MYLSSITRQGLLYGGAVVAVAGVLWLLGNRRRPAMTDPAHDAAAARSGVQRFAPFALVLCGLVAAYWSYRHSIVVVVVTDDGGQPRIERKLAASIDDPVAPGAWSESHNPVVDSLWLVNHSTKTVRVEKVYYDTSGPAPDDPPVSFPPNTAGVFYRIDYVGPDHRPPDHVVGSRMLGASRTWLTWD